MVRSQKLDGLTGPALVLLKNFMGSLYKDDDIFQRWISERYQKMDEKKQRRILFVSRAFNINSDVILALRAICPLKGDIEKDSTIVESNVPTFISLGTRAPFPFDYNNTVILPTDKAYLLARLRVQCREINANKMQTFNATETDEEEDDIRIDAMSIFADLIDDIPQEDIENFEFLCDDESAIEEL